MGSPSPRWLAQRQRDGTLPVARGAVAAFGLVGVVVAAPVVAARAEALPALTERAMMGNATLREATMVLGSIALPALVLACVGALVGGAAHARIVGRGGGAPAGAATGSFVWLVTAVAASAMLVSDLRSAVDGADPVRLAAASAMRVGVVAAMVALIASISALLRARAARDERFLRDRDPDAARDRLIDGARRRP